MGRRTAEALAAAVLTTFLAGGVLFVAARTAAISPRAVAYVPYAPAFRSPTNGAEVILNTHDGQAFGALALDPLLSHPEDWSEGAAAMAYRGSRPLLGWLVALTSFGSRAVAAWSLLAWTAVGAGVLAAGASLLCTTFGRRPDWAPLVLLLPGIAGQLVFGGLSDGLAAGLALVGLACWLERRDRWAVVALCLAALAREFALVVPVALLLSTTDWRRTWRLLLPLGVYAGWLAVLWLRLHALPSDAPQGHVWAPFTGFVASWGDWNWAAWISIVSVVGLSAVAFWRAPVREVRALVIMSVVFASTLSPVVWRQWDVARLLLPVTVVGACLLARRTPAQPVVPDAMAEPPTRSAPMVTQPAG